MINSLFYKGKLSSRYHWGYLFLMFLFFISAAAQTNVSGTVSDAVGPIPGVNILLKGTSKTAVSNLDGTFRINDVPANGVLVFSFIGYKTKEVAINGKSQLAVIIDEDLNDLKEVVVIGYGTQRKEAVTGSVASISGKELRDVPSSNITQALQGRLAGVEMTQSSSKPGAAMQIRIRGTRSLTASNDPLVVLNGIPFAGSIGDINPVDILSVDILKDASATAIYGSRGANGVILVTTNKGTKGQKAKFTYDNYYGSKAIFARYPMMNGAEFVKLRKDAGVYNKNGTDESDDVDIDWQDKFYTSGMVTSHDIAVAGGTEKGTYSFGLGYFKDEAVIPGQNYERYSVRASIDQEIGNSFRFGLTSNSNYSVSNGNNLGMYGVLNTSPIANPYRADGSLKRVVEMPLDQQWVYTKESIENLGDKWIDRRRNFGSYNNIYGEVKIPGIDGLKYRANVGLNMRMSNGGSYNGEGVFSAQPTTPSSANISNELTTHWVIENLITYDRTFAEKHKINVVGLYSSEQTSFNKSSVSARDIPSDDFQFYNLGHATGEISINPNDQDYYKSGLLSYMGRAMYSYADRYMFTATMRSDASSRLAKGHQWNTYPAISAGWNIKGESFMENVNWVNALKLRVGYGETSNQSINPYSTLGRLSTRPYNFGDEYAVGYYVGRLPNSELGWEYSQTWNYGLDFGLFNNRLSGTVEYYKTDTNDLLLDVNLPYTLGVESYTANIGKTQNKGIEFSLNGTIIENLNGWTWDAGINFYSNRNKLISLDSGQMRDEGNWWFVGQPINVIYDYEKVGLWQQNDEHLQSYEKGGNVGMIKVKYTGEHNADGSPKRQIGPEDRQIIKVDPDFQGGFNTRVAYKGFDLGIVGAFQSGGVLISTLYSSSGYLNMLNGRRGNVKADYWTEDNTDAKYPKPGGLTSGDNPKYGSTLGYFDASYLKIRTISLGYNFTQELIKDTGLDRLRIYATVQNPFVFFSPYHKESGMDPETNSYGDENAAITSEYKRRLLTLGTNTPSTTNYVIGLSLTF